jgi:ATP/maltotriose-dependent transcriptional regulator MalT
MDKPSASIRVVWASAPGTTRRMLAPMSGRLVSPTFIGRRDALTTAADALRRAERGRAGTFLVGGEAGIGKTRFAEAIGEAAAAAGFLVLRGSCVRLGSGELPYAPFALALRTIARSLEPDELGAVLGADAAILDRIVGLGLVAEPGGGLALPLDAARDQLLRAVHGTLARLAERRPVLLVTEDLHWADSASLDALAFLVQSLRDERVALLLTFRSDELHRRHPLRAWLGDVARHDAVERLELQAFEPEETRELIAAIRGSAPRPELVDMIHARADGNPLFIEELLAVEAAGSAATVLTSGLRDILLARVASVPDEAQPVLRVAAVVGRHVDARLLAEVCDLPSDTFDAALEAAIGWRVLVREPGDDADRLAFRHALIQELIDDELLPGERVRLHRAVAEALSRRVVSGRSDGPGRWAELADHWVAAHDEPRAFEAALHAADEAVHAYAFVAALAQYRRALAGWEVVAVPDAIAGFDRVELLSRAAEVAWLAGADQVGLLREAVAEADRWSDAARGALLRGRLAYALWVTGEPVQARVTYEDAVARLPPGPATAARAWILARLAQALMLEGGYRQSLPLADSALSMAREVGDRRIEAHALNTLAGAQGELGLGSLATENIERALAIAIDLGAPDEVGRAYLNATEILAISGLDHRALELVREGMDRTASMGLAVAYGWLIGMHGVAIAYDLGRWREAAELSEARPPDPIDPNSTIYALARIVPLAVSAGHWDVARVELSQMAELLGRFGAESQYSGPYSTARAELALLEARPAEALTAVTDGLSRLERTDDPRFRIRLLRLGLRAAADLAIVARDRRDPTGEANAVQLASALRARTDPVVAAVAAMDGGLAGELDAEVATVAAEEARLRGSSDPGAWRDAAARWALRERPYQRTYALWREAEASLEAGDRRGAVAALSAANEIATRLGAAPLGRAISALARRARISLEDHAAGPSPETLVVGRGRLLAEAEFGLTARELDVLGLLARGATNRQIAASLFISVYTVGVHVSRILGKLDVVSRTEAASKAYRLGMVDREATPRPAGQAAPEDAPPRVR